jgi:hypothetical protein
MRLLFDAICAIALLTVVATLNEESKGTTPPNPPSYDAPSFPPKPPISQDPKRFSAIPRIVEPQEPVREELVTPNPTTSVPYRRPPEIVEVEPVCTPSKYEILQYWRLDITRMRHLYRRSTDSCLRQTFGKTYRPLINAVRHGASAANLPEPPEAYAQVVKQRCTNGRICGNGGIIPSPGE